MGNRGRPSRWSTPLGRWLRSYGVSNLLSSLRLSRLPVSRSAVYHWAAGRRTPRPPVAAEIERLSEGSVRIVFRRPE